MAMNEIKAIVEEGVKVSGRYIFRDDFDELTNWDAISGEPAVSGSILTLPAGAEVRTKRKWLYGILVVVAKSTASGSLQIGFHDGGSDYVIWSNGLFRYASTVDSTEGSISASLTETNWNNLAILWESDIVTMWINGGSTTPHQAAKVPNKPLPISIKNIGSGEVQVDLVALYPEPAGVWISFSSGATLQGLSLPVNIVSSVNRIGKVLPQACLLALPYTDSTAALGANASFIGTSRDTQVNSASPYDHLAYINAHAMADAPGTLMIQESPDNSTWITVKNAPAQQLSNPDGTTVYVALIECHAITLRYVRVAYRNGATAQSTFRLSSRVYSI